jgi:hypothetical protein
MITYRYSWKGLSTSDIMSALDPAVSVLAIQGPEPSAVVDIQLDSSTATTKTDLDSVMHILGWVYVSTDPPAPPKGIILRQEVGAKIVADNTTSSTAFVDLLTVNITTENCVLGVIASIGSTALVDPGYFRVTVDGVPVSNGAHEAGMMGNFMGTRLALAAGAHAVKIQWRTDAAGTLHVRPVANPDSEYASLLVREMSG